MGNSDLVIQALGRRPMSDSELVVTTGIQPHQQVNQICRRLESKGIVTRVKGVGLPIVNHLVTGAPSAPDQPGLIPVNRLEAPPVPSRQPMTASVSADGTLLVVPCSKSKSLGGQPTGTGTSILSLLPEHLSERLIQARRMLAGPAHLDDSLVMPAWRRYSGHLYQAAGNAIHEAITHDIPVLIISGGYGLVTAQEQIGWYDRRFALSDWPLGLLQQCLIAVAARVGASKVVALCAGTTDYGKLAQSTVFPAGGVEAILVSPVAKGGGAQVTVPKAIGEAFAAIVRRGIAPSWKSSDGLTLQTTTLGKHG